MHVWQLEESFALLQRPSQEAIGDAEDSINRYNQPQPPNQPHGFFEALQCNNTLQLG